MRESASSRRCTGKSGSPIGSTSRWAGSARLARAMSANAALQSAPSGKSVRPTKPMLMGRTNPATPMTLQAVSNNTHSARGDCKTWLTRYRPSNQTRSWTALTPAQRFAVMSVVL